MCGPPPETFTLFMTKNCDIPYPVYDLIKDLKSYLWPDHKIKTLFETYVTISSLVQPKVTVDIICEALLVIFFLIMMKMWLLLTWKHTHVKVSVQNAYPMYDQNGSKTISFEAAHTSKAHIRECSHELMIQFLYTRATELADYLRHKELNTFPGEDIAGSVWCARNVLSCYTVTKTINGN